MSNSLLLISSGIQISTGIIVGFLFYGLFRKYRNVGFRTISIGFVLSGLFTGIAFIPMGIANQTSSISLVKPTIVISGMIAVGIGFNLILFGFRQLIESNIPLKYYFYIFLNSILFPLGLFYGIEVEYIDNKWRIIPFSIMVTVLLIGTFIIFILDLFLLIHKLIEHCKDNNAKKMHIINESSLLFFIVILFTSNPLDLPINAMLLASSIYFLTLVLLVYITPEVFLTSHIRPYFLIIALADIGIPIKTFHFVNNEYENFDDVLFSGGLTAIQSILQEIGTSKQVLNTINFEKVTLIIKKNDKISLTLGCERNSTSLSALLETLLEKWNFDVSYSMNKDLERQISVLVQEMFVHQLSRLNLFTKYVQ